MVKKSVLMFSAAGLLSALAATQADAGLVIELQNGATIVTVSDNGVGDTNPALGTVQYIGAVGDFDINTTVGISKPTTGSATDPKINLNSLNATSTTPGTLFVRMTDTDFLAPAGAVSAELDFGGTTNGTASLAGYLDSTNAQFGMATPAGALGPFGSGAFAGTVTTPVGVSSPYSATLEAVIVHDDALDITSFSGELSVVPEPGSLALLAIGAGAITYRRRRSKG